MVCGWAAVAIFASAQTSTGGFTATGSMTTPRFSHTATPLNNGMILMAGGENKNGTVSSIATAELYNPASGTFTATGALTVARAIHTATLLSNGTVLITGGENSGGSLASAELYQPATGTFSATGSMSRTRFSHTATLLNNGMVLIAGGLSSSAELYDPATGTFTLTGSMTTPRYGHTATLLSNGMVLITGGVGITSNPVASAELYNPATGTFSATGSMGTPRNYHTATLLNNGAVLVTGGISSGNSVPTATAELYSVATGAFTTTGGMATARADHTATILGNGTVLIAGGTNATNVVASTELYDPTSGSFGAVSSMTTVRYLQTATLLNNGTVLIAGGISLSALASAELYQPGPTGNPKPAITSVSPSCVAAGSLEQPVTVVGSGFLPGSVANWNGFGRTTSYIGGGALAMNLTTGDRAAVGTGVITVVNPSPGGGTSNAVTLPIARSCNDSPATAPVFVQTPSSQTVDSSKSPISAIAPPCGNSSALNGVWFTYTAPADGTLTADTNGSSYQTILAAYRGSPSSLGNIGCSAAPVPSLRDKGGPQPRAAGAKVGIGVNKATQYWILVTAANPGGGQMQLNLSFIAASSVPDSALLTYLPHLVTGGGFVSKLTLVNMSGVPNNVALNVVGQDGSLQASNTVLMQPGEVVRIANPESARGLPSSTQWSPVGSSGPLSINEFFEFGTSSANVLNTIGFNDAATVANFSVPVEFEPAASSTKIGRTVGVALANPTANATNVQLTLRDQTGDAVGTLPVPLAAYGQVAIDLTQSSLGTALPAGNFIGTLSGTSATPFSLIALGDDKGPFFATPALSGATSQVVPYIVSGQNYVTKLTFANLTLASNTVTVTYYDPIGVRLSQSNFVLTPLGVHRESTDESQRFASPQTVSWAVVTSTGLLGVNLFFEVEASPTDSTIVNTVGFNVPTELTAFTFPAEFEPTPPGAPIGRTMGLAMANRNASAANVTLALLDHTGVTVATHTLTLNSNSQVAIDLRSLSEFGAALPPANFIGAVVVTSTQPVAAIALEDDYGPFSAVPVISGKP